MDPCINIPYLGLADPVAAATHLVGALASGASLAPLLWRAGDDPWRRGTVSVFGASMVLLYCASTAYHTVAAGASKSLLRQLDHASIYVLIAGTFTPVVGNLLRGRLRVSILTLVWTLAVFGIVLKVFFFEGTPEGIDMALYLGMGWVGLVPFAAIAFARTHSPGALALIPSGAVFYTLGALSELFGWPVFVPGVFGFHEVFHLAVMAASVCFYVFVLRHALPRP